MGASVKYAKNIILMIAMFSSSLSFAGGGEDGEVSLVDYTIHHLANSNEIHVSNLLPSIPLPCLMWSKEDGLKTFMSSVLDHGHVAHNGYVLDHGRVKRIADDAFNTQEGVAVEAIKSVEGSSYAVIGGKEYALESNMTFVSGSSFIDFSITKNVAGMLLAALLLFVTFFTIKKSYAKRAGEAPKGLQSFFEPIIIFIRDEVARPNIGEHKYEKYLPYLLTIFFFILFCNLLGLIPSSANITGHITVTMVLALFTFVVTNVSGNAHYWGHIFWMPGVPVLLKPFMAVVEFIGLFTKPFSLMIRLFANINAGHIIIMSLVSLIIVFTREFGSPGGTIGGVALSVPFTIALYLIEIFVAFLQAFIFALLSALYIGGAVEEHHH